MCGSTWWVFTEAPEDLTDEERNGLHYELDEQFHEEDELEERYGS